VTYTYGGRVIGSTDIIYEKASYSHLDEVSREIIDSEIEDIKNNAAKNASKNKRIAKIKNAIMGVLSPVINFVREHMFIPAIILGVVLAILLIVFLFKKLHNRRGRAHRNRWGYRSRAGRRRHVRMQKRARRQNVPEKSRRRNHSSHYQKRTAPVKSTPSKHKRSTSVNRRKRNTRESFGKNFFDF